MPKKNIVFEFDGVSYEVSMNNDFLVALPDQTIIAIFVVNDHVIAFKPAHPIGENALWWSRPQAKKLPD